MMHPVKLGLSAAIVALIIKIAHLAIYMVSPAWYIKMTADMFYLVNIDKYLPDFAFSYTSFAWNTTHCVIGVFVVAWLFAVIYNAMIKE